MNVISRTVVLDNLLKCCFHLWFSSATNQPFAMEFFFKNSMRIISNQTDLIPISIFPLPSIWLSALPPTTLERLPAWIVGCNHDCHSSSIESIPSTSKENEKKKPDDGKQHSLQRLSSTDEKKHTIDVRYGDDFALKQGTICSYPEGTLKGLLQRVRARGSPTEISYVYPRIHRSFEEGIALLMASVLADLRKRRKLQSSRSRSRRSSSVASQIKIGPEGNDNKIVRNLTSVKSSQTTSTMVALNAMKNPNLSVKNLNRSLHPSSSSHLPIPSGFYRQTTRNVLSNKPTTYRSRSNTYRSYSLPVSIQRYIERRVIIRPYQKGLVTDITSSNLISTLIAATKRGKIVLPNNTPGIVHYLLDKRNNRREVHPKISGVTNQNGVPDGNKAQCSVDAVESEMKSSRTYQEVEMVITKDSVSEDADGNVEDSANMRKKHKYHDVFESDPIEVICLMSLCTLLCHPLHSRLPSCQPKEPHQQLGLSRSIGSTSYPSNNSYTKRDGITRRRRQSNKNNCLRNDDYSTVHLSSTTSELNRTNAWVKSENFAMDFSDQQSSSGTWYEQQQSDHPLLDLSSHDTRPLTVNKSFQSQEMHRPISGDEKSNLPKVLSFSPLKVITEDTMAKRELQCDTVLVDGRSHGNNTKQFTSKICHSDQKTKSMNPFNREVDKKSFPRNTTSIIESGGRFTIVFRPLFHGRLKLLLRFLNFVCGNKAPNRMLLSSEVKPIEQRRCRLKENSGELSILSSNFEMIKAMLNYKSNFENSTTSIHQHRDVEFHRPPFNERFPPTSEFNLGAQPPVTSLIRRNSNAQTQFVTDHWTEEIPQMVNNSISTQSIGSFNKRRTSFVLGINFGTLSPEGSLALRSDDGPTGPAVVNRVDTSQESLQFVPSPSLRRESIMRESSSVFSFQSESFGLSPLELPLEPLPTPASLADLIEARNRATQISNDPNFQMQLQALGLAPPQVFDKTSFREQIRLIRQAQITLNQIRASRLSLASTESDFLEQQRQQHTRNPIENLMLRELVPEDFAISDESPSQERREIFNLSCQPHPQFPVFNVQSPLPKIAAQVRHPMNGLQSSVSTNSEGLMTNLPYILNQPSLQHQDALTARRSLCSTPPHDNNRAVVATFQNRSNQQSVCMEVINTSQRTASRNTATSMHQNASDQFNWNSVTNSRASRNLNEELSREGEIETDSATLSHEAGSSATGIIVEGTMSVPLLAAKVEGIPVIVPPGLLEDSCLSVAKYPQFCETVMRHQPGPTKGIRLEGTNQHMYQQPRIFLQQNTDLPHLRDAPQSSHLLRANSGIRGFAPNHQGLPYEYSSLDGECSEVHTQFNNGQQLKRHVDTSSDVPDSSFFMIPHSIPEALVPHMPCRFAMPSAEQRTHNAETCFPGTSTPPYRYHTFTTTTSGTNGNLPAHSHQLYSETSVTYNPESKLQLSDPPKTPVPICSNHQNLALSNNASTVSVHPPPGIIPDQGDYRTVQRVPDRTSQVCYY